jgi:2-oxoisovalerate dehydrogenase E1 component
MNMETSRASLMPAATLTRLYTTMLRIRLFEEKVRELFQAGIVKGTAHSYAGQEAIAAGVCFHLRDDDYIGSYHRGHGHCIAKGARMDRMLAELMGKAQGYCGGMGGSMHVADLDLNILGANGIVGATMPLGLGAALASKIRNTDQVTVAFFGDGASNQGVFHEAMNLAAVWKLPMIFVCENNQWALNTSIHSTTSVARIATRAAAYDVPGVTVDGNDAIAVHDAAGEAVDHARTGKGPSLIEAITWRHTQHSLRVNLPDPRTKADMDEWFAKDPIGRFERWADGNKEVSNAFARIRQEAEGELAAAVAFGQAGDEPTMSQMHAAVYGPHLAHREPGPVGPRNLTVAEALNEALHQEMARDGSVFVMGEDVGDTGGLFQVSKGLLDRFGAARVRDTPISEATFCGAGVGAAIAGMRPVVEVQIFDFVTQMMDMIVNQAAKFRFMLGGRPNVPFVIRGPQGGGIRLAAQHSQSLESWFTHIPGLVVIAPSTPYDAKGLLTAAIRDNNPVVFLEHKLLYHAVSGPVPTEPYAIPIGKADIKRAGNDVTIVATQIMVARALAAATKLEAEGVSVEVIDPRTLRPLDEETILASVKKTGRLIVVHEAVRHGGFGAEVAAIVMEKAFDWLDAPVVRIGAPDVPMPFNPDLELAVIPSQQMIEDAIRKIR